MPSKSQAWQGEDQGQWPLAANCGKWEPLWWDWMKHELQYTLWANSSGEMLGFQRCPVPLQVSHDHLAVIYVCTDACVRKKRVGRVHNVCTWHHFLYFPTPSYPFLSQNSLSIQSPEGHKSKATFYTGKWKSWSRFKNLHNKTTKDKVAEKFSFLRTLFHCLFLWPSCTFS